MKGIYGFFSLLIASALFTSCRLSEDKAWDVDLLAPVLNAELTIGDLLKDSSIRQNADQSLTLVQVMQLKELNVGDIIKVPDTVEENTVTLQKLEIGRRIINRNITLGEVARNAGFTGQLILANHGNSMAIPPLIGLSSGDIDVNAQNFFETATFIDGKLEIQMRNGFPVELTNIDFELRNKSDNQVIVTDIVSSIKPNATFKKTYSLKNKTVEGKLVAKIKNMNSPGSGGTPVQIDTTDALEVQITAYDMQVYSAKAIFPAQNVVNDSIEVAYDLDDAAIKLMRVRSGNIFITTVHTLKEKLNLHYQIPGATKNGIPLDIQRTVNAAPANDSARLQEIIPIDGYTVDLTGRYHDTFNTYFNILLASIDSTGVLQSLSLEDKIYIYYGLRDIVPEYARGYLGQRSYKVGPEKSTFESFDNFVSGELTLGDVKLNLELLNGVGAPAEVIIKSLKATNSKTKKTATLTSAEVINKPIKIAPALDNPFRPTPTIISFPGSDVKKLLEILPDQFEYEMEVKVNPDGNTSNYNDFVYNESKVTANLNVELPLEVGLNGFTLQDTFPVAQQDVDADDLGGVKNALLHINMENSFPIDAEFQAYVIDKNGKIEDSLFNGNTKMLAGKINPSTNKVETPTTTRFLVEVNENKWNKLQQNGRLVIRSKLSTLPVNKTLKIYSTYQLKISIAAEVRYRSTI